MIGKVLGKIVGAVPGGSVLKSAVSLLGRYAETPEQKQALEEMEKKALSDSDAGQVEINKIGAGHRSIFVAGWRPAIGWTCALAFFWRFVGYPVSATVLAAVGAPVTLPEITGWGDLNSVLMGMLGLGLMRSYEKSAGVSR